MGVGRRLSGALSQFTWTEHPSRSPELRKSILSSGNIPSREVGGFLHPGPWGVWGLFALQQLAGWGHLCHYCSGGVEGAWHSQPRRQT